MAVKGFMGKLLFVNLGKGSFTEEQPNDEVLTKYLGGYGLGAYILYTRQKAKVDPLGPEAMLGFLSGPLSGTAAITVSNPAPGGGISNTLSFTVRPPVIYLPLILR